MLLTTTLLAALLSCNPGVSTLPPSEPLTVQINLAFDPSIPTGAIRTQVRQEATAIWRAYGVELRFAPGATSAALSLDVVVENARRGRNRDDAPAVLGHTEVISSAAIRQPPVRISFDAVEALLDRQHGITTVMHEYMMAAALGRVLAHEIGHILLGAPAFHDDEGLMRTTFSPDDLARPERSRFQLTARSITRLKARLASLSDARANEVCAKTIR